MDYAEGYCQRLGAQEKNTDSMFFFSSMVLFFPNVAIDNIPHAFMYIKKYKNIIITTILIITI